MSTSRGRMYSRPSKRARTDSPSPPPPGPTPPKPTPTPPKPGPTPGPDHEMLHNVFVGLLQQFLPKEGADFLTDFADAYFGKGSEGISSMLGGQPVNLLYDDELTPPKIMSEEDVAPVSPLAEKVGGAIITSLTKQAQTFSKTPQSNDLGAVGKFIGTLKASIPLLCHAAASAAQPEALSRNSRHRKNAPIIDDLVSQHALYHVANTVSNTFIGAMQDQLSAPKTQSSNSRAGNLEGGIWDTLKKIGTVAVNTAVGTLPVLLPMIQQKLNNLPKAMDSDPTPPGGSGVLDTISSQAVDYTATNAVASNYLRIAKDPTTRGVQAVLTVAKNLSAQSMKETNDPSFDSDFWAMFHEAVKMVAPAVSQFAQMLNQSSSSLSSSAPVQTTGLTSGLVAGAHLVANSPKALAHMGLSEADFEVGGILDWLSGAANTIVNVAQTVAPVAAKVLPLITSALA